MVCRHDFDLALLWANFWAERVLDRKDTTFPYTGVQCQRLMEVYETMKSKYLLLSEIPGY